MAIEAYIVAFDIKDGGSGWQLPFEEKLGAKEEGSIGRNEFESGGLYSAKSGLVDQVAQAKLVEVLASSAAEAVEVVRLKYKNTAGASRAVVKPNTNFKLVI